MAGPYVGSDAVVKKGGTEIGYATGLKIGMDLDSIKEYAIGDADPKVFKTTTKSYPVSIDMMCMDTAYGNIIQDGDTCSIVVTPGGTEVGSPSFTIGNVSFTSWEITLDPGGVVMEAISGEGTLLTIGVVA